MRKLTKEEFESYQSGRLWGAVIFFLLLFLFVGYKLAFAQKDQMKMGEAFGTAVIKKGKMKAAKPMEQKKPEPVKTQEALEIEHKKAK